MPHSWRTPDPAAMSAARPPLAHLWLLVPARLALPLPSRSSSRLRAPHVDPGHRSSPRSSPRVAMSTSFRSSHLFDLTGASHGSLPRPAHLLRPQHGRHRPAHLAPAPRRTNLRGEPRPRRSVYLRSPALHTLRARAASIPTLGSKSLAEAILQAEQTTCNLQPAPCNSPQDLIADRQREMTAGYQPLLFYTRQPVHLVNGWMNGPCVWQLLARRPCDLRERRLPATSFWSGPRRYLPAHLSRPDKRVPDLARFGPRARPRLPAGGKAILTNQP